MVRQLRAATPSLALPSRVHHGGRRHEPDVENVTSNGVFGPTQLTTATERAKPVRGRRLPWAQAVLARPRPPMAQFNASMHGHQPPSMLHSKATPSARRTRAKPARGGTTLTSARGTYRRDAHVLFELACMLRSRAKPAPPPHVAFRHRSRERQRACILRRRPIDRQG